MGSRVRGHILGRQVRAANPCTAFSINIPRTLLRADPELAMLLETCTSWMGPGRQIVAIDMPDLGDVCNFIMASSHEEGEQGEWDIKGDIGLVRERFAAFEPRVHRYLDLVDPKDVYIWKFSDLPELETWRGQNGKVLLVGDSAHAMLPNSSMVSNYNDGSGKSRNAEEIVRTADAKTACRELHLASSPPSVSQSACATLRRQQISPRPSPPSKRFASRARHGARSPAS